MLLTNMLFFIELKDSVIQYNKIMALIFSDKEQLKLNKEQMR
jgi:hypothetical protein